MFGVTVAQVKVAVVHRFEQTSYLAVVVAHAAVKLLFDPRLDANLVLNRGNYHPVLRSLDGRRGASSGCRVAGSLSAKRSASLARCSWTSETKDALLRTVFNGRVVDSQRADANVSTSPECLLTSTTQFAGS